MKIKSVEIRGFRRFESVTIADLPPAKLVVLAGPNGSGKSSLFDAFSVWHQSQQTGLNWDASYHSRAGKPWQGDDVKLWFHSDQTSRKTFYFRSPYRNDPEFQISELRKQGDVLEEVRVRRMIDSDGSVSRNYQRLASTAFEDAFSEADESTTLRQFRDNTIGEIARTVGRLFPDLKLHTLGNPLQDGTFRFAKGSIEKFSYKNLSGGEKAAFDLVLDVIIKRRSYDDTVYVIDEPEAHMNTRLQGELLEELCSLIPVGSQLWISTHSIGMMRKARELYAQAPGEVVFLDFEGHDFDQHVTLKPIDPARPFWERVLKVALDDLADLVAPREIVLCEGNPKGSVPGKNEEHDARCYEAIFADEFPDTMFVSSGNSIDVAGDRLKFAAVFPRVIKGVTVRRLVDRDDHSAQDQAEFKKKGIWCLSRRHLESYLYDEEILLALCDEVGRTADFPAVRAARQKAMSEIASQGKPSDDVKSAAGLIYTSVKSILALTAVGNDQMAFARNRLAPLVKPQTNVYAELRRDIFGL
jgi:predicted ATPase